MRNKKLIVIFSVLCSLTLLIVLSSVIFSVQHISEYCINADSGQAYEDTTLGEKVLGSHNIKKGNSIFLMDKEEATADIESAIPTIKVINIEKKFPNIVFINYVKIFDYLQVYSGGKFYILSNDCKVTRITEEAEDSDKIIRLIINGDIGKPQPGDYISSTLSQEVTVIANIMNALERLNFREYDATQLIDFIDITNEYEIIYLRTGGGVYIRLLGANDIAKKLQIALSLYKKSVEYRYSGTITVDNHQKAAYSETIYYGQ